MYNFESLSLIFSSSLAFITALLITVSSYLDSVLHGNREKQKNENDNKIFKVRIFLWIQQTSLFTLIFLNSFFYVISPISFDLIIFLSLILSNLSAIFSLFSDNVSNINNKKTKRYWIFIYFNIFLFHLVLFITNFNSLNLSSVIFSTITFVFAISDYLNNNIYKQTNPLPAEFSCDLLEYLSFSHINPLISTALKEGKLEIDDLPHLYDQDSCRRTYKTYANNINKRKKFSYFDLIISLYYVARRELLIQGFFQLVASAASYLSPLALMRILQHVSGDDSLNHGHPNFHSFLSLEVAILLLFFGPIIKGMADGQNYSRGKHYAYYMYIY